MIPSEAMFLANVNNFIENLISGYQTLTVSGRGMIGYQLNTNDISGGDGQMFIGANLPAREITIEYMLNADTPELFIQKLDKLTDLLMDKQFWFYFNDDKSWSYQGTVSSFEAPEKGQLLAKGSFTITCSDPHKYGAIEYSNGNFQATDNAKIVELDFRPIADVGRFSITNEKWQSMIIDGTVKAGDTIKINPQLATISINGVLHNEWFGYSSDIENFEMTNNIKVSATGDLNISYRRVRL